MADIGVEHVGGDVYRVTVSEGRSATTHTVTVGPAETEALGAATPEVLVEASMRFLLEREPKESILREFPLSVIGSYFPEYESRIIDYL